MFPDSSYYFVFGVAGLPEWVLDAVAYTISIHAMPRVGIGII
jgi:hypothetical protein